MSIGRNTDDGAAERLLLALAEQLKLPLTQIALQAELGSKNALAEVEQVAARALHLIDSYLLSTELNQQTLQLEPVSLSSVLYDAAQQLQSTAQAHNCDLELNIAGKYAPVMAHRASLESAIVTLGQSLLEAQPQDEKSTVVIAAYKAKKGIMAGVFGDHEALTTDMFRRARYLYGGAAQTLPNVSASNGAGIYVADALFQAMSSELQVARHHNLTGLAAKLLPSSQLQLV